MNEAPTITLDQKPWFKIEEPVQPKPHQSSSDAPVVVIPVAPMDWHLAVKLLRWISIFGRQPDIDLVVLCSTLLDEECRKCLEQAVRSPSIHTRIVVAKSVVEQGYFTAANGTHKAALDLMERDYPGRPMLWMEADCVVVDADWFAKIDQEYRACGKPFLGDIVPGEVSHMTGVAIYPHDWRKVAPILQQGEGWMPRWGWDSQAASQTLPQCRPSKTIRQVWRPPAFTRANWRAIVPEGCCLFHQDKSGTLIDVLCAVHSFDPIGMNAQIVDSTYATERHISNGAPSVVRLDSGAKVPPPQLGPTEILYVTCAKDIPFLHFSLQSVKRYARGFSGVSLVVPKAEWRLFEGFAAEFGC